MGKELEVKNLETSPATMIELAISKGADLDKLDKLLTTYERWTAIEAKKEYYRAMADFKTNAPKIDKDKTVTYKEVRYNHASLGNVVEKISTELSKHGLSASWSTKQDGFIAVTCKIVHVKGYGEETTISATADSTGSKNSIQAIGSTITYLQRYSLLCLTGLATYDDNDAGTPVVYIRPEEKTHLNDLIKKTKTDLPKFLAYLKVESLDVLLKTDNAKAISALISKLPKQGGR